MGSWSPQRCICHAPSARSERPEFPWKLIRSIGGTEGSKICVPFRCRRVRALNNLLSADNAVHEWIGLLVYGSIGLTSEFFRDLAFLNSKPARIGSSKVPFPGLARLLTDPLDWPAPGSE